MSPVSVYGDVTVEVVAAALAREALGEVPEGRVARLEALFDTHHPRLYRLARRMSRDAGSAGDLVQETFLRVARSLDSVPCGNQREAAWLVRVLVNICRDEWRRARRTRAAPPGESGALPPDPESAAIAHITIWRALRHLPPRRRAVIVMHELEGIGIREIATLLGVSAVTVRWHLSRGRRELADAVRRGGT